MNWEVADQFANVTKKHLQIGPAKLSHAENEDTMQKDV